MNIGNMWVDGLICCFVVFVEHVFFFFGGEDS